MDFNNFEQTFEAPIEKVEAPKSEDKSMNFDDFSENPSAQNPPAFDGFNNFPKE